MAKFNPDVLTGPADAWASLDLTRLDEQDEEHRRQALEVCRHYQAVFADEQGRFVLEDLVRTFLIEPEVAKPGDDLVAIGIRQGHQNVVRRILSFIEVARTGGV